jgi:hypothetical protein
MRASFEGFRSVAHFSRADDEVNNEWNYNEK